MVVLCLLASTASGDPILFFNEDGADRDFVIPKDQKIKVLVGDFHWNEVKVMHEGKTYTRVGSNHASEYIKAGEVIVGPVTLKIEGAKGAWFLYELIPTQSVLVPFEGLFPNSAALAENAIYTLRLNIGIPGIDFFHTATSMLLAGKNTDDYAGENFYPLDNFDPAFPGPGTVVRKDGSNWTSTSKGILVFEKAPYATSSVQTATVQVQTSPDLSNWADLTTLNVQTSNPSTYLRFKIPQSSPSN